MTNSSLRSKDSQKLTTSDEFLKVKLQKSQVRFKRMKVLGGKDIGHGDFFLLLDTTALKEDIYIPISIASGKKATGFIYQIEGTAAGKISTTDLTCHGEGLTKITLGTLLYAKIPARKTASFRMLIEIRGGISKEYKIVINRINYKLNPGDARYKRLDVAISTKAIKFL